MKRDGKTKTPQHFLLRRSEGLPNQGSNLDFTDPESVVLPITPLGTVFGCKNTIFFKNARKKRYFLGYLHFLAKVVLPNQGSNLKTIILEKNR